MDPLHLIVLAASILLAINVGGNNSAAEMGPAFGSGIRSKLEAVILIAVFSMIGAIVAGEHVVHTIGSGIMDPAHLKGNVSGLMVILLSATALIGFANFLRVPVATSHAMVGAVVGMGLYHHSVQWDNVTRIVIWWLATPLFALVLSYCIGRFIYPALAERLSHLSGEKGLATMFYRGFVTLSGCYMAFSAGSNSLAKAVGPVVGAGILQPNEAAIWGGLSMALGAFLVGHRLLHTVGKGITPIDPLKATLVEVVCGSILLVASHAGVPVSLAEIVTCSVIGFGAAHSGLLLTAQNKHVKTIYKLWPICPLFTCGVSFGGAWLLDALSR